MADGAGEGTEEGAAEVAEEGVGGWVAVRADRGVWGRKAYGSGVGEVCWGWKGPPFMSGGAVYGLGVSVDEAVTHRLP